MNCHPKCEIKDRCQGRCWDLYYSRNRFHGQRWPVEHVSTWMFVAQGGELSREYILKLASLEEAVRAAAKHEVAIETTEEWDRVLEALKELE